MRTSKTAKKMNEPEFGIDSRYKSIDKKVADGKNLMEARLKRLNSLPRNQIIKAKLLQLKLKMQEYLSQSVYEEYNFFTNFLSNYIDTIYDKRSMFAKDNHREPNEEFMFRLMLHSELTFKNVCQFQKRTWYQSVLPRKNL